MSSWLIGISGASGINYVPSFLDNLDKCDVDYSVAITKGARYLMDLYSLKFRVDYNPEDLYAPFSSGSYKFKGMVIFPTSMNTIARIASGLGDDLISRVAKVTLKERLKLIIVFREAPLSTIDLENLTKLSQNGAIIYPMVVNDYSSEPIDRFHSLRLINIMERDIDCNYDHWK